MRFHHRSHFVACGAGVLAILQGCAASGHESPEAAPAAAASPAATDAANPDPSVRIALRPSPMFSETPGAMGQSGVVKALRIRGTSNQISLYFDARAEAPQFKDLAAYSAWGDDMLKERDIRPLEIAAPRNPIKDAGFPFVARTYVNVQRPGSPAPTGICDAAGVRFETPGGFWTISWNSDLGKIDQSMPVINELLRVMDITRVARKTR